MQKSSVIWIVCALSLGLIGGWFGSDYLHRRAENIRALLELGQVNEAIKSGDTQLAILSAVRAATLNPENHLAFLSLAELYERIGHKTLAVSNYEEALRLLKANGGGSGEQTYIQRKLEQIKASSGRAPQASNK